MINYPTIPHTLKLIQEYRAAQIILKLVEIIARKYLGTNK